MDIIFSLGFLGLPPEVFSNAVQITYIAHDSQALKPMDRVSEFLHICCIREDTEKAKNPIFSLMEGLSLDTHSRCAGSPAPARRPWHPMSLPVPTHHVSPVNQFSIVHPTSFWKRPHVLAAPESRAGSAMVRMELN